MKEFLKSIKFKIPILIVFLVCLTTLISYAQYRRVLEIPIVSDYIHSLREESEEYKIFSMYLNAYIESQEGEIDRIFISKNGRFIKDNIFTRHIASEDLTEEKLKKIKEECASHDDEVWENACLKNSKPLNLKPKFNLKKEYILIDETQLKKDKNGSTRTAIFEKYSDYRTIIRLSRIGFNKNLTEAVFYVEFDCGALCSSGGELHLVKKKGVWESKEIERFWVQ